MAAVGRDFARFANCFEAVAIGSLAALDLHLLYPCASEANFVYYLCLLELNGELLGEHARRQPETVVVSMGKQFNRLR